MPASKKKITDLAIAVTGAARDKALDADTTRESTALIRALSAEVRAQLIATRDEMLDKKFRAEIAALRTEMLGEATRKLLRAMIDEALGPMTRGEVGLLREEAAGAPLRKSVDDLLDEASPHLTTALQASLASVKKDAEADAEHYKMVAVVLAAAMVVMVGALGVAVHLVRTHRTILKSVLDRLERLERS